MNYILSFWSRAPWIVWVFAALSIGLNFHSGLGWGIASVISWAVIPPLTVYLLEHRKK